MILFPGSRKENVYYRFTPQVPILNTETVISKYMWAKKLNTNQNKYEHLDSMDVAYISCAKFYVEAMSDFFTMNCRWFSL